MDEWQVVINGKPEGPFVLSQLKNIPLTPTMFVRKKGMDDYKEAHEVLELRELFGFKKITIAPQYFATMDLRLLAVMIDILIISGIYFVLALILISQTGSTETRVKIALAGFIIIPIVKFIYASIMEASNWQATLAKKWLDIKICNEEGLRISLAQSIIRNLAGILSLLTFGIGYLMGFFNKKQQCLHDKIAGTLVIKDRLI